MNPNRGNLYSINAMLIAMALFSLMDAVMKLLSVRYPAMQVAALRGLCSLPLVFAYVAWRGAFGSALKVRWPLHFLRGALGIGMLFLFTFGLRQVSLAQAYSIVFVAPALITALSVVFLKESVSAGKWIAVAVGLAGVVVVLRPSGEGMLTVGGLALLGAAVCYSVSAIVGRVISRTDRSEHMVLWLMLMLGGGAGVLAAPDWVGIGAADTWLLLALAVTGFLGQLAITEAFNHGQASSTAPFEYSALAWALGLDWLLWAALPDRYTIIGSAIIIGSGIYLVRREREHASAEHP